MAGRLTNMRLLVISLSAVVLLLMGSCASPRAKREPLTKTEEATPIVFLTGNDSSVKEQQCLVIQNEESFLRVQMRHFGERDNPSCFQVDFEKYMVVAVFSGTFVNAAGYSDPVIKETETELSIRLPLADYQSSREEEVQLYAFLVIPITKKPISVEQGFRLNTIGDMKWVKVKQM